MYLETVFSFYVLLYHFVGHSFFGLIFFGSFSDIIKRNFSLTLAKLNVYVDMSVWLFVGKQYYRLNEFFALEENPDTVSTHEPKTITARSGSVPFVEFRDVTFGYDKRVVLDHLSFKVMDGDQVTLTGRTGAGKSTIFKLLLGLYKPQSGEVLIHGVPAADIRDDERRRLFGCVEQTFHMVPGTVRDQITLYDSTISDEAVHIAAELTGLKDTIESMEKGYDTRCTDDLFSQGQWQLLSIARAAAATPSMLLFDEITANLDAETERAVLSALKRVAENRTVISISHRTSAELGRIIALTD